MKVTAKWQLKNSQKYSHKVVYRILDQTKGIKSTSDNMRLCEMGIYSETSHVIEDRMKKRPIEHNVA